MHKDQWIVQDLLTTTKGCLWFCLKIWLANCLFLITIAFFTIFVICLLSFYILPCMDYLLNNLLFYYCTSLSHNMSTASAFLLLVLVLSVLPFPLFRKLFFKNALSFSLFFFAIISNISFISLHAALTAAHLSLAGGQGFCY